VSFTRSQVAGQHALADRRAVGSGAISSATEQIIGYDDRHAYIARVSSLPSAKVANLKSVLPGSTRQSPPKRASPLVEADLNTATDAALMVASAANNPAAFRILVDRHLVVALAIARRMLRDDAEAEDIAQEALLRLWRGAANIDLTTLGAGGVRPWLRRVVSNLCIDRIRASRRTDVTDEVPEQIEPATQVLVLTDAELSARVDQALQRLPERQRLALTLFHYQGLTQLEVGDVLGVSDEAIESLLARARRSLKADLKDDWRALLFDDGKL
jgi:RNA polymerase sigma-70 factor, ECF subfamily